MDEKMIRAQQIYQKLCEAIDNRGWKYNKDEEKLVVYFGVRGDDLPMQMILAVDAQRQLVRLMSPMTFCFSGEKRVDGAIAACTASYKLAEGNFDYDLGSGRMVYRMTASFLDGDMGEGLFLHMLDYACAAVDAYNDKFEAINNGNLAITDFVSEILG